MKHLNVKSMASYMDGNYRVTIYSLKDGRKLESRQLCCRPVGTYWEPVKGTAGIDRLWLDGEITDNYDPIGELVGDGVEAIDGTAYILKSGKRLEFRNQIPFLNGEEISKEMAFALIY